MGLEGTIAGEILTKETREFSLMHKLYPQLKVVGAHEQLKRVRDTWDCGKVDTRPVIEGDRLFFGIRVCYSDLREISMNACMPTKNRISLIISIEDLNQGTDDFLVRTFCEQAAIAKLVYGGVVCATELTCIEKQTLSETERKKFNKANSEQAREILDNQVGLVLSKFSNPKDLAKEARLRIKSTPHMPFADKLKHCWNFWLP